MTDARGVEIWSVDLTRARHGLLTLEADLGLLAPEDRERAAQMQDRTMADERLAAKIALRALIEAAAGSRLRAVPFRYAAAGKPALPGLEVQFSLSHVAGRALIALAAAPVGVDIERMRAPAVDARRRARIEAAALALAPGWSLPSTTPEHRFLQGWTRLEAVAKADGRGIGWLLSEIGVMGSGGRQSTDAGVAAKLAGLRSGYEIVGGGNPGHITHTDRKWSASR